MSHLDTAYKIGAAQAAHDFQIELQKQAYQPGNTPIGAPASVAVGSPAEAVRGSAMSGTDAASRNAAQGLKVPVNAGAGFGGASPAGPMQAAGRGAAAALPQG